MHWMLQNFCKDFHHHVSLSSSWLLRPLSHTRTTPNASWHTNSVHMQTKNKTRYLQSKQPNVNIEAAAGAVSFFPRPPVFRPSVPDGMLLLLNPVLPDNHIFSERKQTLVYRKNIDPLRNHLFRISNFRGFVLCPGLEGWKQSPTLLLPSNSHRCHVRSKFLSNWTPVLSQHLVLFFGSGTNFSLVTQSNLKFSSANSIITCVPPSPLPKSVPGRQNSLPKSPPSTQLTTTGGPTKSLPTNKFRRFLSLKLSV